MAITLRHDAAAVALPSSSAQRKYGQSLVLQQQQQKYQGQQAGYDRLFDAYKQDTQNRFQFGQAADQRVFQAKQAEAQNLFQLDRDQAKFDQQQQQQRKADFDAARNRIDTYAKDALSDPDLPHDLRQRIQNLVSGKMVALGGGYDGPAQQQFLDQYNSQLAAILSEIPPKQPKAPPQPNFHTDQNGNQWVESGPGKWEQVPQEKSARPLDFNEYYNAEENKGKFDKDLDATMQSMQDAADEGENPGKVTEEAALEEMKRRYGFRQKALGLVGDPTAAPSLPGQAPPTAPELPGAAPTAVQGTERSILESPASGIPVAPPDQGQPPSPQNPWAEAAAGQSLSPNPRLAPPTSGPLAEANPPQAQPEPLAPPTSGPLASTDIPQPIPETIAPPDFDKLAGASTSAEERAFLNKMKDVYRGQPPEVQNAISVFLSPNSLDEEFIAARDYLKAAGIDMKQLAAESPKTVREKVQGKMRAKYGENYDSF
jgi:hypothetical protein